MGTDAVYFGGLLGVALVQRNSQPKSRAQRLRRLRLSRLFWRYLDPLRPLRGPKENVLSGRKSQCQRRNSKKICGTQHGLRFSCFPLGSDLPTAYIALCWPLQALLRSRRRAAAREQFAALHFKVVPLNGGGRLCLLLLLLLASARRASRRASPFIPCLFESTVKKILHGYTQISPLPSI